MARLLTFPVLFVCTAPLWAQCDTIPRVQGSGDRTPCIDTAVRVRGVVTASFPGMQGFFLQDPAGDADPSTSDGIFVFSASAQNLPAAGTVVEAAGRAVEFTRAGNPGSVTEIDLRNGGSVTVISATAPAIAPVEIDPLRSPDEELERFEGMLVSYPASTVLRPSNRFGEYFVLRNDRLPPTVRILPARPLDGQPLMIDQAGGAFRREVKSLDRIPALTGALHFDFGKFRLEPTAAFTVADGGVIPSPAPPPPPGLSVAFMNVERLVRTLTAAVRENKLRKLALAITEQLQSPDLIGVAEVEDLELLEEIGRRAGGYQAVLLRGCDFGNINVGLLYKPGRIRVRQSRQLQADAPQLGNGRCTLPDGRQFTRILFDRPPLLVELDYEGQPYTVIVNHWRSRIGTGTTNEAERVASAEYLAAEILALEARNLIVMGDFNDTEQDISILTLRDRAGLTLLTDFIPEDSRYSLLFEGLSQAMDHIFVSPALTESIAAFGYAHYNADFPITPNENAPTPIRAADHDAAFLQWAAQAPAPRTK